MKPIILKPLGLGVRYKTELCDAQGRVIRPLQSGRNLITDWGMDALASTRLDWLLNYLHLGDTSETLKRVADGGYTVTCSWTGPDDVDVTSSANFFQASDVGKTLKIDGWPELKVLSYTDAQNVTCAARGNLWLPGFTPTAGPHSGFGIHDPTGATLANQFTRFNTYDTGSANYQVELNDSGNSRWNHQRIFLSNTVSGSAWTIWQLGWSDGNGGQSCFGKVTLGAADVVPIGKKYRVTLNAYMAYTPIDLSNVVVDWGATIGQHTCAIRTEQITKDQQTGNPSACFLVPRGMNATPAWWTSAASLIPVQWQDDAGFTNSPHGAWAAYGGSIEDSAYVNGDHTRTRRVVWPDTVAISNATLLGISDSVNYRCYLAVKPNTGTITKPSGYWCDLTFRLHWTRELTN